jgi:ribosome biogenesis GTPase
MTGPSEAQADADLPAHALAAIGFDPQRFDLRDAPAGAVLMRLIAQHRDGFEVHDGQVVRRAKPIPKLKSLPAQERAAVGDFAWVQAHADEWHVVGLLPRSTVLQRGAAGERYAVQTLAANVDRVLLLCGLDGDFNPRRIERYLSLIAGRGIGISVLLTKADLYPQQAAIALAEVPALAQDLEVLTVNALDRQSLGPLLPHLRAGRTLVLMGSSGVGKSTLTNTLIRTERFATQSVRRNDSRGRHTTVHRQLVKLPEGACLIDSPGLREIKLLGDEEIDHSVFSEIGDLEALCRFRDCEHESEPGCAVTAALQSGALSDERYTSYQKLRREQQAQQNMASGARKIDERRGAKLMRSALQAKSRK